MDVFNFIIPAYFLFQEVLLFPHMKPDDPNKHNAEGENAATETPVQNGA